MNKVDSQIRSMMLSFPSIFPNRLKCLQHLFMGSGNGYRWDSAGCLSSEYDSYNTTMQYNDLDDALSRASGRTDDISQFHNLKYEEERLLRQHREKNIDLYAQFNGVYDEIDWSTLSRFNVEWSAFRNLPYSTIDDDWLIAAEELLNRIYYAFNRFYTLHWGPEMIAKMPEDFQKTYSDLVKISRLLHAERVARDPEHESREELTIRLVHEMLAEIKDEEESSKR